MKKYFVIILAIIMLYAFVACSANKVESETTTTTTNTTSTTAPSVSENKKEAANSTSKKIDKDSVEGMSNVRLEDLNDVTKADGSMNETVIGTTGSNSNDWGDITTQHQGFQTEEIPIG